MGKIKLYNRKYSGNCYKVRLLLHLLNLEHEIIDIPIEETKKEPYLNLNPLGLIPTLTDDDFVIHDSLAILVYLAQKYNGEKYLPKDPEKFAKINKWLSFSVNEINNGITLCRAVKKYNRDYDYQRVYKNAFITLNILDNHLKNRDWLELETFTLADIACFPYIDLAHEGEVDISNYKNVIQWIKRIKESENFIAM